MRGGGRLLTSAVQPHIRLILSSSCMNFRTQSRTHIRQSTTQWVLQPAPITMRCWRIRSFLAVFCRICRMNIQKTNKAFFESEFGSCILPAITRNIYRKKFQSYSNFTLVAFYPKKRMVSPWNAKIANWFSVRLLCVRGTVYACANRFHVSETL